MTTSYLTNSTTSSSYWPTTPDHSSQTWQLFPWMDDFQSALEEERFEEALALVDHEMEHLPCVANDLIQALGYLMRAQCHDGMDRSDLVREDFDHFFTNILKHKETLGLEELEIESIMDALLPLLNMNSSSFSFPTNSSTF